MLCILHAFALLPVSLSLAMPAMLLYATREDFIFALWRREFDNRSIVLSLPCNCFAPRVR